MTRTVFGLCALMFFAGCGGPEVEIKRETKELTYAPPIIDLGEVLIGEEKPYEVDLTTKSGGVIRVLSVSVINLDDDNPFLEYEGETPFAVEQDEVVSFELLYAPRKPGYHQAEITIGSENEGGDLKLTARGRAVSPEVSVWPVNLDFGPVLSGDTKAKEVRVTNNSELPLIIERARLSDGFRMGTNLPVEVEPDQPATLVVVFAPDHNRQVAGRLEMFMADTPLPSVKLGGNNCEEGDPAAYDIDKDGFSSCAGDCDDEDADIRPGVPEIPDGIDQNCNGTIDEGTTLYDDDGDGFCDTPVSAGIQCSDGTQPGDCTDGSALVSPAAVEDNNNGIDDDCDGVVDLGTTDNDADGYSDLATPPDCDDNRADRYPFAPEVADFIDNDCDLIVDEGTENFDDDGDCFCENPNGCVGSINDNTPNACPTVPQPGDCDDSTNGANIHPGAAEVPDYVDNNCDGKVDEGTDWYDDDGDGYTEDGGDCNDADPLTSPVQGNCP